jgi:hypothetical protein
MNLSELRQTGNFVSIETVYNLAKKYDNENSPFSMFLDLIGYSDEYCGTLAPNANNEYLELEFIADAIKEFVIRPSEAEDFIEKLLDAELEESGIK